MKAFEAFVGALIAVVILGGGLLMQAHRIQKLLTEISQLKTDKAEYINKLSAADLAGDKLKTCTSDLQTFKTFDAADHVLVKELERQRDACHSGALEMVIATCTHVKKFHPESFAEFQSDCQSADKTAQDMKKLQTFKSKAEVTR